MGSFRRPARPFNRIPRAAPAPGRRSGVVAVEQLVLAGLQLGDLVDDVLAVATHRVDVLAGVVRLVATPPGVSATSARRARSSASSASWASCSSIIASSSRERRAAGRRPCVSRRSCATSPSARTIRAARRVTNVMPVCGVTRATRRVMLTPASTRRTGDSNPWPSRSPPPVDEDINARLDELETRLPVDPGPHRPPPALAGRRQLRAHQRRLLGRRPSRRSRSSRRPARPARPSSARPAPPAATSSATVRTGVEHRRRSGHGAGRVGSPTAAQSETTKLVDQAIDTVEQRPRRRRSTPSSGHRHARLGHPVRAVDQGRARRAGQGAEHRRSDAHEQVGADRRPPRA